MSEIQLNYRMNPGTWSVNEILAHLNSYSEYYNRVFLEKLKLTKRLAPKEDFVSSPLGRSAWKSMKLGNAQNIKRKYKAPRSFNPSLNAALITETLIDDFNSFQEEFLELLERSKQVNIQKVKVPISVSKLVRLRLGDAFLFVSYHNERHMQQIKNLINHPNFPKK